MSIPCEQCSILILFSEYENHALSCNFKNTSAIPCEKCLKLLDFSDFNFHNCASNTRNISSNIPCESCQESIPFDSYQSHSSTCIKRKATPSDSYENRFKQNLSLAVNQNKMTFKQADDALVTMINGDVNQDFVCENVINRLNNSLLNNTATSHAWLVVNDTNHYNVDFGDNGFGCGYRNLMMLLSSIWSNPLYSSILSRAFDKFPTVPNLQEALEKGWSVGFDLTGQQQLGTVIATSTWIGPTEIYAILWSIGIKCSITDFHQKDSLDQHSLMFDFIEEYFKNSRGNLGARSGLSYITRHLPLFLQHQGHSRTIIGYEATRNSENILLFDPSYSPKRLLSNSTILSSVGNCNPLTSFRRGIKRFLHDQYQILSIDGVVEIGSVEWNRAKVVVSRRVPGDSRVV